MVLWRSCIVQIVQGKLVCKSAFFFGQGDVHVLFLLTQIGTKFVAGEAFAGVESVKATDEIYTPVGGVVVEVNSVCAGCIFGGFSLRWVS